MMKILGIETSTAVCSAGIVDEHGSCGEKSLLDSHIHSEKLLTIIKEVCASAHVPLSELHAIAVSIGPGSFTGLRIGLSSAKGLCFALEKPLIAVPTFEAVAYSFFHTHPDQERLLCCVDAKQGEYYIGVFTQKHMEIQEFHPVRVGTLASIVPILSDSMQIVTDREEEVKKGFPQSGDIGNILSYCKGDGVAAIAMKKAQSGAMGEDDTIEPRYLKDFIVRPQPGGTHR